jgi:hypothetical protein
MFTERQIRDLINAQPFKPFRIHLSDERAFDVPDPDAAWVLHGYVEVGLDLDAEGFARRATRCAILHITGIEELQPA